MISLLLQSPVSSTNTVLQGGDGTPSSMVESSDQTFTNLSLYCHPLAGGSSSECKDCCELPSACTGALRCLLASPSLSPTFQNCPSLKNAYKFISNNMYNNLWSTRKNTDLFILILEFLDFSNSATKFWTCKYSGQHLRHDAACTLGLLRWQPLEYSKVCALVLASSPRARQF